MSVLTLPLLAVLLSPQAAAQQLGGSDLTGQFGSGFGVTGQLTGGLGAYTYTGQAAPSLTGGSVQWPTYDLQGAAPSLTSGNFQLPTYDLQGVSAPRGTASLDPLAATPARVGAAAPLPPVADRYETGYAAMPEVDDIIRKMSLGSTDRGASLPDFTSTQATAQAGNAAAWQPQWQAPDLQVPPWVPPSRSAPPPQTMPLNQGSVDWAPPPLNLAQHAAGWQTPATQLPSNNVGASLLLEDSSSLLHLRGAGLTDPAWRPLPPLPAAGPAGAVAASAAAAAPPPLPQAEKSLVLQVDPLSPVEVQRAPRPETIVQVDELLCNPPCATGHGFCARDAGSTAGMASAGAARCFCKSPYSGPTCGVGEEQASGLWSRQLALLQSLQELVPNPLERSAWMQIGTLVLAAGTFAVLLTMCCRCTLPARERGSKCFSPGELVRAVLRRGEAQAERAPLLRAPPRRPARAPELEPQRARDALVEAWVKSQPRRPGSAGRRRPALDSVPQVFKDESDEEN